MMIKAAGQPPHRPNSLRLAGYDYSQCGAYFVTICAHQHRSIFGEVLSGEMHLNQFGKIVQKAWNDLPHHYPHILLDAFCVMPNHVHGIILITDYEKGEQNVKQAWLPEIVRAFKSFSAKKINSVRHTPGTPVWQRNYYDHVIRSQAEYETKATYILTNPTRQDEDEDNFEAI